MCQYFGHLMGGAYSLEKTLMLGKIDGQRRKGRQRVRWLDDITSSGVMSLSKLWEAWPVAVCEITEQDMTQRLNNSSNEGKLVSSNAPQKKKYSQLILGNHTLDIHNMYQSIKDFKNPTMNKEACLPPCLRTIFGYRLNVNQQMLGSILGFPDDSVVKNLPANAEDAGSIPGLGRSPGERNGNPLQNSCLGNPKNRGT